MYKILWFCFICDIEFLTEKPKVQMAADVEAATKSNWKIVSRHITIWVIVIVSCCPQHCQGCKLLGLQLRLKAQNLRSLGIYLPLYKYKKPGFCMVYTYTHSQVSRLHYMTSHKKKSHRHPLTLNMQSNANGKISCFHQEKDIQHLMTKQVTIS